MAYDFSSFTKRLEEVEQWFSGELGSIHTGRATPTLLDGVAVSVYGARSPINHVASVSVEDPRTLRVSPWDKSQIKDIEKAINDANLGVSVSTDDAGLRVFFPELTGERRAAFVKVLRERLEDARVSVRKEREEVWSDIQEQERKGTIAEDDKFRYKEQIQKMVDETNAHLEAASERKEKEIQS